MKVIAIAIQKGGTGKTTTATALANAAVHQGYRVLAVDLDPQGNFTFTLGANANKKGSYEFMEGEAPIKVIQHIKPGLDVICASWNLSTITSTKGSARRLQRALNAVKGDYDYCFIDTPPTVGELQFNALQASTGLVIPLQADIYNLQSLYQIVDTAKQIQKSNEALEIKGFVLTQYDARSTLSRQMQQTITERAEEMGVPSLGVIRSAVAVKEATAFQESLFDYAPKAKPTADYMELFNLIK